MNSDGPYTADEKFVKRAFESLDNITQHMFLAWATLVRIEGDAKRAQNWISEAMNLKICDERTHNIPSEKPAESETLSEAEIALLAGTAADEWKTQKWTTYESVDAVDVTESKEKGLGYIYAVEFGDYIKIGYTVSPKSRLATHAATARNYGTFKTGRVLLSPPHKDYIKTEKTLHDYFKANRKEGTELFEMKLGATETNIYLAINGDKLCHV